MPSGEEVWTGVRGAGCAAHGGCKAEGGVGHPSRVHVGSQTRWRREVARGRPHDPDAPGAMRGLRGHPRSPGSGGESEGAAPLLH